MLLVFCLPGAFESSGADARKVPATGAWLLTVSLLLSMDAIHAQPNPVMEIQQREAGSPGLEGASVQSLSKEEAAIERLRKQAKASPPAYQDRYLDNDSSEAVEQPAATEPPEQPGLRSITAESRLELASQSGNGNGTHRDRAAGLRLEYRQESLNHGEWAIVADASHSTGTQGAMAFPTSALPPQQPGSVTSLTVSTQGFPLTPHTMADAALGDVRSETTDGLARVQRFAGGSSSVRGLRLQVRASDFDLRLGLGQRQRLVGSPFAGPEDDQGRLAWLGYTQGLSNGLYTAAQLQQAHGIPDRYSLTTGTLPLIDNHSLTAAIGQRWRSSHNHEARWQLTLLHSRSTAAQDTSAASPTPSGSAHGASLDAAWQQGPHRLEGNLFAATPRLMLGDQWVSNGTQGLSARYSQQQARLYWGVGLAHEWPTSRADTATSSGAGYRYSHLNGHWHHRIDRRNAWGGALQWARWTAQPAAPSSLPGSDDTSSHLGSAQASLYLDRQWPGGPGNTRLQWTRKRNQY